MNIQTESCAVPTVDVGFSSGMSRIKPMYDAPVVSHSAFKRVGHKMHKATGLRTLAALAALALAALLSAGASAQEKKPDVVGELRNQDAAFSLLIEAYQQVQNGLIQSDYDARLQAAAKLTDVEQRRRVIALARQERDLRVQKLSGQLGNLSTTYDYARQRDEREAGIAVPSNVDTRAAAVKLRDFLVIACISFDQRQTAGTSQIKPTYNRYPAAPVLASASEKVN